MSSLWRRHHAVADRPLTCREVGRLLQRYLDGDADERTTARVAEHLEDCRRCGLEADIYREIKASLARRAPTLPETTLARLRRFSERLASGGHAADPSPNGDDPDDDHDAT